MSRGVDRLGVGVALGSPRGVGVPEDEVGDGDAEVGDADGEGLSLGVGDGQGSPVERIFDQGKRP